MAEQLNTEHLQILVLVVHFLELKADIVHYALHRGEICPSRQSRRECKIFASGVNFFQKQRNLQ